MVNEYDILATDCCGPSLEDIFNRLGRQFSPRALCFLACQLLSRLEFAHSRSILHGDLGPNSVTISYFPWQCQQVILSCPVSTTRPGYSAHDDLLALGDLIFYLSSGTASWGEFQQYQYNGKLTNKPNILDRYTDAVFSSDTPDYSALRKIFHNQYVDYPIPMLFSSNNLQMASEESAIPGEKRLFEILKSKLSDVGRRIGDPTAAWSQKKGINLLQTLPNILQIYTDILVRYCPSHLDRFSFLRPYQLPNRLWLDLLWYVGNVRNAPAPFQKVIVGTIYKYITTLLEIIPFGKMYWVRYLAILASLSKELEIGFQRRIWDQTRLYWQDQAKTDEVGITEITCSPVV